MSCAAGSPGCGTLDAGVGDAERWRQIRLLEELKGAAAAAQARVTSAFARSQVEVDAGQRGRERGGGCPGRAGQTGQPASRRPARGVGQSTGFRDAAHPGRPVPRPDERVAGHADGPRDRRRRRRGPATGRPPARTKARTPRRRRSQREARRLAYELDPGSILRRGRRAVADRRVTLRPAPDTMTLLTGFLPVAQGVAAYAALTRDADQLKQSGDPRSRGRR